MSKWLQSMSIVRRAAAQPVPRITRRCFPVEDGIAAKCLCGTDPALIEFRAAKFEVKPACHLVSSGSCDTEQALFSTNAKVLFSALSACMPSLTARRGAATQALQSLMQMLSNMHIMTERERELQSYSDSEFRNLEKRTNSFRCACEITLGDTSLDFLGL